MASVTKLNRTSKGAHEKRRILLPKLHHQFKASTTMDLGISIFLISVQNGGLEKLGLIDQNWLERNFSGFLLRTLVVGRRQHSESIEIALDME